MADVVCALRGGPGSYRCRLAALRHAAETGDTIHFISVIDPAGYEPLYEGEQHAIRTEMAWRDLVMAKAAATRAEIEEPHFTVEVRVGETVPTIAAYVRETDATLLIVGHPRPAPDALPSAGGTKAFVEELEVETGVAVRVEPPLDE
jgi:nucleotide-binding universal stress UspA family protein